MQDSARDIWKTALGELQLEFSKHNYQTWLDKTFGLSYRGSQFVIGVPNTFVAEYLDRNQRSQIEKTLIHLTRRELQVLFRVASPDKPEGEALVAPQSGGDADFPFNPRYTFDSFVVGDGNRLAYSAARGVAEQPGKTYNPLFIYGGSGLGKTHLLHAIGQQALERRLRIRYVSCERFISDFVSSIQEHETDRFRSHYRSVDLLMIDDIHFVSGKEGTEECLFHTFNELHSQGHQIVVTSDRPPKAIPRLAERLRSRFEWGLIADIQPPGMETKLAILQAKTEERHEDVPRDALEFIARQIQENIRELEGNLNRVIAYARLLQARATPELAAKALENIAAKALSAPTLTPALMIGQVAHCFGLTPEDLIGQKRDKEVATARQVAMFLIREETDSSLEQVGREFSGRNPSTVKHACEKIASELAANPALGRRVREIRSQINAR